MLKTILSSLAIAVSSLGGILLFNTFRFSSKQKDFPQIPQPDIPKEAIQRLQSAIALPTISHEDTTQLDSASFLAFHSFLEVEFPLTHKHLRRETIQDFSLLYHWKGTDPNRKPILLLAHFDVVPPSDSSQWSQPPFSGNLVDNKIYGRGTIDDKGSLMAILESVEMQLKAGKTPAQDIYLAFGHNEEVGGSGAKAIAKTLEERGIKAEFILDEGGYVAKGFIPGMDKPISVINVAEKGYMTVDLSVEVDGGHASRPEKDNAIALLSRTLVKLENNPFRHRITEANQGFWDYLGPEFSFEKRIAFANQWLFEGMLVEKVGNNTTVAPTIFRSGVKENVLPATAHLTLNIRIIPGETSESVIEELKSLIADERIELHVRKSFLHEPSPVSDTAGHGFQTLFQTVREVFPESITTPGLLSATTDSRHYYAISENIYRFLPVRLTPEDASRFHGVDEYITVDNYKETIFFYHRLMENLGMDKATVTTEKVEKGERVDVN